MAAFRMPLRPAALLAGAALALGACATPPSLPTESAVGYNSSDIEFFRDAFAGRLAKRPVALEGRLSLPAGRAPFPVVVWQHGSDALNSASATRWTGRLRRGLAARGIGLFVADSHSGRGIRHTMSDQTQLSGASRAVDTLRALEALARDSRIDPARIGIAGWGSGGTAAIRASHEAYAAAVLPGGPRYAAHVVLYPFCGYRFERYEPSGAPFLFLLGGADNYTKPEFCEELAGDPDGFLTRDELVRHFERWAEGFGAPLCCGVEVWAVRPDGGGFQVETGAGVWRAENVVVATGTYQA
ncbi:MAG: hypothetical protein OXN81_17965, partial [Alphaproteobacteria bacterium]|nr:hypothetical protein [Alphaproteobacteria bacterium]